ncbi:MAG TPA: phosphoglycerate mutase family protein [Acidimicrobiales bacterium]|nr:phosphoglycerate mutase family protein [Acidimicrobiales bacterium]
MSVLLVRHAVAGSRAAWSGDDARRPLDDRGRRQAAGLVATLRPFEVVRVLSSPAVRCVDTVAPTAAAAGVTVEQDEDLLEGNGSGAIGLVRSLFAATPSGSVVVCSHGDVIPEVLDNLGVPWERCQKASTWVLDREGTRVRGRYLRPPA